MRRIPETDLARICVLSPDEQPIHLRQLKEFRPPHTLNPFRRALPDIVNLQHELLGATLQTAWAIIEDVIGKSKESEDGIKRNLAVAKALYNYCKDKNVVSYGKAAAPWSVGYGNSVAYWSPFYSVWEGQAAFMHFDPRLTHPLTAEARRFAFSMMHQRLRVDDPDFADVDLFIVRFGRGKGDSRVVKLHDAKQVELYTYDELTRMINTTYRLWAVELERRQSERRRAGGNGNPMEF